MLIRQRFSIVIVLVMLLLLRSPNFFSETKLLWASWWFQQESIGSPIWQSKKVSVKQPKWYHRLQSCLAVLRNLLSEKTLYWWVCCLLALTGLCWINCLRWVLCHKMKAEREASYQGGWVGSWSDQSTVMHVDFQVRVVRDCVEERNPILVQEEVGIIGSVKKNLTTQTQGSKKELMQSERSGAELLSAYLATEETEISPLLLHWQGQPELSVVTKKEENMVKEAVRDKDTKPEQSSPLNIIARHFSELKDPRIERTKKHQLLDIVTITICAVVGGADNWVEVAVFGKSKENWFRTFLDLPNGIPSHDTFGRVFRLLDPQQWQAGFLSWVETIAQATKGQIVPIDGKTLRRSHDKTLGRKAIHMVSAWASDSRVVLGQVKVDEKSNEITAIPILLDMLALSGCIVTIDAMGCQKNIAAKIVDQKADYALALKNNQSGLYEGVEALFAKTQSDDFEPNQYCKTTEKNHGRQEIRQCWTISDPKQLAQLHNFSAWKGLQTVVRIRAEQQRGDKTMIEDRYYISSLSSDAKKMLQVVRGHWSIENSLHWVLDVAFREDDSRIRKGYGAQNFAVLRHLALNLLTQETNDNYGIKAKRKKAGWNEAYLLYLLDNFT